MDYCNSVFVGNTVRWLVRTSEVAGLSVGNNIDSVRMEELVYTSPRREHALPGNNREYM